MGKAQSGSNLLKFGLIGAVLVLPALSATGAAAASLGYHFPSPPIASAGSIGPGQSLTFDLRVTLGGAPDPGGPVYLIRLDGMAGDSTTVPANQCGNTSTLSATPLLCTADGSGVVALTYRPPADVPAQGRADWQAQNAATNPTIRAITHYVYTTVYRFTASPIAPSGSLGASASATVTLTAKAGLDQGIAYSQVYLSFKRASGGGSAKVGMTALTSTPARFVTDSTGSILITYMAPSPLPSSGIDSIIVRDLQKGAHEISSDSYAFSPAAPVISVSDSTVVEGDQVASTGIIRGVPATFTVSISPVQSTATTVQYVSLCGVGDKGCGEDFKQIFSPVTVTIPANASHTSFVVSQFAYIGGHAGETYNEGWFIELETPGAGVLGRSMGEGLLLPDVEGTTTALPNLYVGGGALVPNHDTGGLPLYFVVTLGAIQSTTVTFHYATSDGSAGASDYAAASGTGSIAPGLISFVVAVDVLPNSPPASNKTFTMTISAASGGLTIADPSGTGTILSH